MVLLLVLFVASLSSLSYKTGETFSYEYDSSVVTAATQSDQGEQSTTFTLRCIAKFKVLLASTTGTYIQMVLTNVRSTITMGEESEDGQHDDDSEKAFSNPIYFTHRPDGSIADVAAHEQDEEDVVNIKVGVLYALQTSLSQGSSQEYEQVAVIDPQGSHYEYVSSVAEDDILTITSHFSNDDFIGFVDEEADESDLILDGTSYRQICGGRVLESSGFTVLQMNQPSYSDDEQSNEDESDPESDPESEPEPEPFPMDEPWPEPEDGPGEPIKDEPVTITTVGTMKLGGYVQGNDEEVDFPYATVDAFLNAVPTLRRVPHLHPSWYAHRTGRQPRKEEEEEDELDMYSSCPGNINVCKGFDRSWSVGNSNVGLRLSASAVAGLRKGCSASVRSYIVGGKASINVLILGRSYTAASAIAEYGQVNGAAQRNKVELKVFGHVFYSKSFSNRKCAKTSIGLASFSKDFKFSYGVLVYVVHISFSVGIKFTLSANLVFTICPSSLKASASLVPKGTATLYGGATASVAVARAGVEIRGSITDYLDPTASVSGSSCKITFSLYNNVSPINAELVGWWQTRSVKMKGIIPQVTWGKRHEHVFWKHSWGGARKQIFSTSYGAK